MTQVIAPLVRDSITRATVADLIPLPRSTSPDTLPGTHEESSSWARPARPSWLGGQARGVILDSVLAATMSAVAIVLGVQAGVAIAAAASWPLLLLTAGHYRQQPLGESAAVRAQRVLSTGFKAGLLVLATVPWFIDSADPMRLALLVAAFSAASGVPALLLGMSGRPTIVLAGHPHDVRDAMAELLAVDTHDVVAVCLTHSSSSPLGGLPSYVDMSRAAAAAIHHQADALVVLPGPHVSPAEVRRLHWAVAGSGTQLYLGTGLLDVAPGRTRVLTTSGLDLLHVAPAVLHGPRRLLKDVVERVLACLGVVMISPVLLAIAVLIRLDSPGSAIFRQQRIGRDGKPFTMLKFRSMAMSAERERNQLVASNEKDGVLFKIQADPRVTTLGKWLRRYSLDELPQLWNVVRGDMSLVGPRPALPDEVKDYDHDPCRRLVVKPGLTGLWQVSGRSDLTWAESVRLDLRYVENWSLRLDAEILLRTVSAVLGHRGAY